MTHSDLPSDHIGLYNDHTDLPSDHIGLYNDHNDDSDSSERHKQHSNGDDEEWCSRVREAVPEYGEVTDLLVSTLRTSFLCHCGLLLLWWWVMVGW